jgi:hypothetical protein
VLGLLAGVLCCYAIGLKHKLGFDDALDVVGVHLVGGAFGAISLGFLAVYPQLAGQHKGLFYGGGIHQLGVQVLGPVAVGLYSFAVAWILGKIIDKTMGFRIPEEDEALGIDLGEHAETAYELSGLQPGHGTVIPAGHRPAAGSDTDKETVPAGQGRPRVLVTGPSCLRMRPGPKAGFRDYPLYSSHMVVSQTGLSVFIVCEFHLFSPGKGYL